jgi:hypothetical protein
MKAFSKATYERINSLYHANNYTVTQFPHTCQDNTIPGK